ncbi:MAG TPA: RagB/SusD family nutrient uptake outer membrane protein [Flavisolibacter sp.]|nr:RagB/SusD family nutrient uptake outer membrane protein [Flavisolibacter sp.]
MKNYFKYTYLFISAGLILSSCTKKVDLNPTYTINGDASFTKIEDYEAALIGAYSKLKAGSYYGSLAANGFVGLPDMLSDNLFESTESLANYTNLQRWRYTADDANVESIWLDAYSVVQQANLTLRNIDKLSAANPGGVNRVKGQALALRALAHFDLLRYFGEDYDRASTKMGIPYVEKYDIEQKPARLTVAATLAKIEADLKTAKQLMSNMDRDIQSLSGTSSSDRAYIDTLVVDAMLARMYNYSGVSESAIQYGSIVIDSRPLAGKSVFPLIWQDASTEEVIWSVKFESGNSGIGDNIYYVTGNRASYQPTQNLLALYDQNSDIRFTSYFQEIDKNGLRLVLSKYLAKQPYLSNPDGVVDFKVFRTGEMYLIRAEAYAKLSNDVMALTNLNALRTARGENAGTETGAALMTAIFNERRIELVAEGHRFFDLKRTTRTVDRTTDCSNFCYLPPSAREWNFPIPQSEITANPNMKQNPGY